MPLVAFEALKEFWSHEKQTRWFKEHPILSVACLRKNNVATSTVRSAIFSRDNQFPCLRWPIRNWSYLFGCMAMGQKVTATWSHEFASFFPSNPTKSPHDWVFQGFFNQSLQPSAFHMCTISVMTRGKQKFEILTLVLPVLCQAHRSAATMETRILRHGSQIGGSCSVDLPRVENMECVDMCVHMNSYIYTLHYITLHIQKYACTYVYIYIYIYISTFSGFEIAYLYEGLPTHSWH